MIPTGQKPGSEGSKDLQNSLRTVSANLRALKTKFLGEDKPNSPKKTDVLEGPYHSRGKLSGTGFDSPQNPSGTGSATGSSKRVAVFRHRATPSGGSDTKQKSAGFSSSRSFHDISITKPNTNRFDIKQVTPLLKEAQRSLSNQLRKNILYLVRSNIMEQDHHFYIREHHGSSRSIDSNSSDGKANPDQVIQDEQHNPDEETESEEEKPKFRVRRSATANPTSMQAITGQTSLLLQNPKQDFVRRSQTQLSTSSQAGSHRRLKHRQPKHWEQSESSEHSQTESSGDDEQKRAAEKQGTNNLEREGRPKIAAPVMYEAVDQQSFVDLGGQSNSWSWDKPGGDGRLLRPLSANPNDTKRSGKVTFREHPSKTKAVIDQGQFAKLEETYMRTRPAQSLNSSMSSIGGQPSPSSSHLRSALRRPTTLLGTNDPERHRSVTNDDVRTGVATVVAAIDRLRKGLLQSAWKKLNLDTVSPARRNLANLNISPIVPRGMRRGDTWGDVSGIEEEFNPEAQAGQSAPQHRPFAFKSLDIAGVNEVDRSDVDYEVEIIPKDFDEVTSPNSERKAAYSLGLFGSRTQIPNSVHLRHSQAVGGSGIQTHKRLLLLEKLKEEIPDVIMETAHDEESRRPSLYRPAVGTTIGNDEGKNEEAKERIRDWGTRLYGTAALLNTLRVVIDYRQRASKVYEVVHEVLNTQLGQAFQYLHTGTLAGNIPSLGIKKGFWILNKLIETKCKGSKSFGFLRLLNAVENLPKPIGIPKMSEPKRATRRTRLGSDTIPNVALSNWPKNFDPAGTGSSLSTSGAFNNVQESSNSLFMRPSRSQHLPQQTHTRASSMSSQQSSTSTQLREKLQTLKQQHVTALRRISRQVALSRRVSVSSTSHKSLGEDNPNLLLEVVSDPLLGTVAVGLKIFQGVADKALLRTMQQSWKQMLVAREFGGYREITKRMITSIGRRLFMAQQAKIIEAARKLRESHLDLRGRELRRIVKMKQAVEEGYLMMFIVRSVHREYINRVREALTQISEHSAIAKHNSIQQYNEHNYRKNILALQLLLKGYRDEEERKRNVELKVQFLETFSTIPNPKKQENLLHMQTSLCSILISPKPPASLNTMLLSVTEVAPILKPKIISVEASTFTHIAPVTVSKSTEPEVSAVQLEVKMLPDVKLVTASTQTEMPGFNSQSKETLSPLREYAKTKELVIPAFLKKKHDIECVTDNHPLELSQLKPTSIVAQIRQPEDLQMVLHICENIIIKPSVGSRRDLKPVESSAIISSEIKEQPTDSTRQADPSLLWSSVVHQAHPQASHSTDQSLDPTVLPPAPAQQPQPTTSLATTSITPSVATSHPVIAPLSSSVHRPSTEPCFHQLVATQPSAPRPSQPAVSYQTQHDPVGGQHHQQHDHQQQQQQREDTERLAAQKVRMELGVSHRLQHLKHLNTLVRTAHAGLCVLSLRRTWALLVHLRPD